MKMFLYWFVQFTWGLPLNFVGAIVAFGLICMGYKPKTFGYAIYFEIGHHWGGVNLGGFFFVQKKAGQGLKRHEYGHSFQNIMLGIFMLFVVTIPSAIRYHYRNVRKAKGHSLPPYDSFWCEGWATKLGDQHDKR